MDCRAVSREVQREREEREEVRVEVASEASTQRLGVAFAIQAIQVVGGWAYALRRSRVYWERRAVS